MGSSALLTALLAAARGSCLQKQCNRSALQRALQMITIMSKPIVSTFFRVVAMLVLHFVLKTAALIIQSTDINIGAHSTVPSGCHLHVTTYATDRSADLRFDSAL